MWARGNDCCTEPVGTRSSSLSFGIELSLAEMLYRTWSARDLFKFFGALDVMSIPFLMINHGGPRQ